MRKVERDWRSKTDGENEKSKSQEFFSWSENSELAKNTDFCRDCMTVLSNEHPLVTSFVRNDSL